VPKGRRDSEVKTYCFAETCLCGRNNSRKRAVRSFVDRRSGVTSTLAPHSHLSQNQYAPRIFPWGEGAYPEAIHNLRVILKIIMYKSCCKYNITLFATAFICIQLKLHVPSLNHSVVSFFLILLIYFSKF
jgi:hypothetical protein